MKNWITLLLLFCVLPSSFATHIIGGSLSYEYLGNDQYNVRLEILRDCYNGNPNAFFDNPANIGIFDQNNNLVDSMAIPFDPLTNDTISIGVPNSVCVFPPSICVHRAIYEQIITLPSSSESYTLAYQRCCRPVSITNIPDPLNTGMTFHTTITPSLNNSSPIFNTGFPVAVFVGTPFIYNGSAYDLDGDSLVYELNNPFAGASAPIPEPDIPSAPPYDNIPFIGPTYGVDNMLGGNYPLTIDSQTGEMSAIPSLIGLFQIAYAVKEYRNGELISTTYREFVFLVLAGDPNLNYDISGQVLVNGTIPLDAGTVQILERNILNDSLFLYEEQSIGNQGAYNFNNIPAGVFYIKAIVDPSSMYYVDYLPTYYEDAAFWYEASPINQCDTSQINRDIHLIHVDSLNGMFILDGFAFYAGDNSPAEDIEIVLVGSNGEPLTIQGTGPTGYFKFEQIPSGDYFLYADILNSNIDNSVPPLVTISDDTNIQLFIHDDILSIDLTNGLEEFNLNKPRGLSIFPNPGKERSTVYFYLEKANYLDLEVFDVSGNLQEHFFDNQYFPAGNHSIELLLEPYLTGVYYLRMSGLNWVEVGKLVKY